MSNRVLSTDQAKVAITKIQGIVSGRLAEDLGRLGAEGATLCDANVWDGAEASRFRSDLWPQTSQALQRAIEALNALRENTQRINQNIMIAGGNP